MATNWAMTQIKATMIRTVREEATEKKSKSPISTGQDEQDEDEAEPRPEQRKNNRQDESQAQCQWMIPTTRAWRRSRKLPDGDARGSPPAPPQASECGPNYLVYQIRPRRGDRAARFAEPAELERLRAYLDQQLEP